LAETKNSAALKRKAAYGRLFFLIECDHAEMSGGYGFYFDYFSKLTVNNLFVV